MRTALSITLPLDSTKEEIAAAVDSIERFFGDSISPSDIRHTITVNAPGGNQQNLPLADAGTTTELTPSGERDKKGMPWDARIHAATKNKTADGSWRYKRGADDTLIANVEAQIKAAMGSGTAASAPPPPPAANGAPPPPPGGSAPPPPPPSNVAFTNFVQFVAANVWSPTNNAGKINPDWLKTTLISHGVANGDFQNMAHMPEDAINGALNAIKTAYQIA